jgi:alpha-N-arabinofuranosidase
MRKLISTIVLLCLFAASGLKAQTAKLTLDFTKPGVSVSPRLYGLMTEEINYSYDGGLYAELIRNRIFKNDPKEAANWSVVHDGGGKGNIQLIGADPENVPADQERNAINAALTTCLKLTVENTDGRVGIANDGYWGIPVKPATTYRASFYIKGGTSINPPRNGAQNTAPAISEDTAGPITVSIESNDGKTVYASGIIDLVKSPYWKKYQLQLTTAADVKPTTDARFVISTKRTGTYYFNLVSLFPPTFNNRPNGNRIDIMNLLAAMKPSFLRFPGGNFLEGLYFADAFPWKKTLGPLEERPGHPGSWSYRASDGMGLLEFLEWCEDLHMEPLLAVYAGYALKGDHIDPGPLLKPYVDDALEEIEYVTGSVNTYWGAKRAQDGHPEPFKLNFVEIGNEDGFDRSGSYDGRFTQFYDAIKAKYPALQVISTVGGKDGLGQRTPIKSRVPQAYDEHYYRNAWQMEEDAAHYDNYDRKSPKIFVGEWATREGAPTPNMNAALGDAAWMSGMERNSDHVIMSCYAPLFVNVNPKRPATDGHPADPGGMQWPSDLIGYNALTSYGSPSYYAQKMFTTNVGDKVVPITGENIPTQTRPATRRDSTAGTIPKPIPSLFYVATRDTKKGMLYIKIVNAGSKAQEVTLDMKGLAGVDSKATLITLKASKPEDTNTITEPEKIVPVSQPVTDMSANYKHTFDAYSVNVLQVKLK